MAEYYYYYYQMLLKMSQKLLADHKIKVTGNYEPSQSSNSVE